MLSFLVLRRLLWVKFEFSAVKEYSDPVIAERSESTGAGLDHLDLRVEAFGDRIGDMVGDVVEQPAWTIARCRIHLMQRSARWKFFCADADRQLRLLLELRKNLGRFL